jgi:hypothetical protein
MSFIYGTPMFPKSDENHIACHVAYEIAIYLAYIDDITNTHLCVFINNIIIPNIGTLASIDIPFRMHLAHIVCVNSLVMIKVLFRTHLTLHVFVGTLAMVYISFKCS